MALRVAEVTVTEEGDMTSLTITGDVAVDDGRPPFTDAHYERHLECIPRRKQRGRGGGETATQQRINTEDSRRTREGRNRGSDRPPYRVEQRFPTSREIQ